MRTKHLVVASIAAASLSAAVTNESSVFAISADTGIGMANWTVGAVVDRGLVAIPTDQKHVYLGCRLLRKDSPDIAFNVFRSTEGGAGVRLNARPLKASTDFVDTSA